MDEIMDYKVKKSYHEIIYRRIFQIVSESDIQI